MFLKDKFFRRNINFIILTKKKIMVPQSVIIFIVFSMQIVIYEI